MKGIDVSENNGAVDWNAVAAAGYQFAIVRASYGRTGVDDRFLENVEGAHAAGLKVGAYHYSYALNAEQAAEEAAHCGQIIANAGVLLELPVWYDMEDADGYKQRHGIVLDPSHPQYDREYLAELFTDMCKTFLENIGLDCGVYASLSWFDEYIDWKNLDCAVWNAQWGVSDDIEGMMWQYTDQEYIAGASRTSLFDANIIYE